MIANLRRWTVAAAFALAIACFGSPPGQASQGSCIMPTTGTVSGLTLVQDINACNDAIQTANGGATAPTNITSGPQLGQLWLDTSGSPLSVLKIYDGANWLIVGTVDATHHILDLPIGGGTNSISSATTTDLCSVPQSLLTVTGNTTIASFSNTCVAGTIKGLVFASTPQLTHNATSMILPNGGSNITAAAGDVAWAVYLGGSNWRVLTFQRADGTPLSTSAVFTGAVFFQGVITPTALTSGVNDDWNPTGLSGAETIRATPNSAGSTIGGLQGGSAGRQVTIVNIHASAILTIADQLASSTAAYRFALSSPLGLHPGQSATFRYDATSSLWRMATPQRPNVIAGGFKNFKITNDPTNGTTLNTNLLGTADAVTLEDASGYAIRLTGLSCSADNTVSGAGGLDTGAVANSTQYFFWWIYNPTTGTASCMFSLRTSAFTGTPISLPSGYTFAARGHGNFTDGSAHWLRILCRDHECGYVVTATSPTARLPEMANGTNGSPTAPTWTPVALAGWIPTTATAIRLHVYQYSSSLVIVAPNNAYGANTSTTNPPYWKNGGNNVSGVFWMPTESTNIYWASDANAGLDVGGWYDPL